MKTTNRPTSQVERSIQKLIVLGYVEIIGSRKEVDWKIKK